MTNSNSSPPRPDEFELIAELFAPLATSPRAFGLKDDAAIIPESGTADLVVTADALIEGVHFLESDPADSIAKKALRVNLSDLAAKGCKPHGYLLVLAIPSNVDMPWLTAFARGLGEDQKAFGISLLGGDTSSTPGPLTIAITAFGLIPKEAMLRRSGAKTGDLVYVSGTIGAAEGGLACLKEIATPINAPDRELLIQRYRLPEPRLSLGQALRGLATSAIDVSDGLLADLGHVADASRVRIVVDAARVPVHAALTALWGEETVVHASTAGDDYEIAFTAPASMCRQIAEAANSCGISVTEIGRVEEGAGTVFVDKSGREISVAQKGFRHF